MQCFKKTKVNLLQTLVILTYFGYPVSQGLGASEKNTKNQLYNI
jgi:hypothetical protein